MKIWGRINSSNVRKVLWCAEELGLDYEHIPAGGEFGLTDTPEYRMLNPNGRIPCLEDGDLVLWESNAIVRYLARQYGAAPFSPAADVRAWARTDKWMDWTSLSFAVPFRGMFWNLVHIAPEQRDHAAIESGAKECARLMTIADSALATSPFLSGQHMGIADIPLGTLAYLWLSLPVERPALQHLDAWYARLCERPAYRKAVMTPVT
ncbi:MAG: glutathione S-transferase family protein [Corticimicrobacter sp.]|uniref:glutathione S-transferase family protein n=1 Tax=Corticimicrobacter sp. TaxID=2678536 RepID=UPI0032DBDAEB